MDKIKLYSPIQVGLAAFFGGPLAAVYTIWQNFRALGNRSAAAQTMLWGGLLLVLLIGILPFLPDKFPNLAIPIATLVAAQLVASKLQMSKQAILESDTYGFQSNWLVVGVCVICIVIFFAVALAWIFALIALDVIKD